MNRIIALHFYAYYGVSDKFAQIYDFFIESEQIFNMTNFMMEFMILQMRIHHCIIA